MLGSAFLTCAFGAGQLLGIHKMWYFTVIQACAGECHAMEVPRPSALLSKDFFVQRNATRTLLYLWLPRLSRESRKSSLNLLQHSGHSAGLAYSGSKAAAAAWPWGGMGFRTLLPLER